MNSRARRTIAAVTLLLAGLAIVVVVATRPDAPDDEPARDVRRAATGPAGEAARGVGEARPPEARDADPAETGASEAAVPGEVEPGRIVVEVLDDRGRPVSGAEICVGEPVKVPTLYPPGPSGAKTGGDGRVVIVVRPVGSRRITVSAPGFWDTVRQVRPGGDVVRISLIRASRISGRVIDGATRKGIARVALTARHVDVPEGGPHLNAGSGADGGFTFEKVPPGRHVISVGARAKLLADAADDFLPVRTKPVEAGREGLEIVLTRGLTISGRIENLPEKRGLWTGPTIDVMGLLPDGKPDPTRTWHAYSAPDGSFRIGGLPEGDYRLRFVPAPSAGNPLAPTTVPTVAAGTDGLVVRLNRGQAISGRIVDDSGSAVSVSGPVYVYATGTLPGQGAGVVVKSGADGRFATIPLDPTKTYEILATGFPGHSAAQVKGVAPVPRDVVIVLARAHRILGKVLDEQGKPVPSGVGVRAMAAGLDSAVPHALATAYTTNAGTFALEDLGDYEYRVRAGGGRSAYQPGETVERVRPGLDAIVLRVKKGVRLSGRLVDHAGKPVKADHVTGHQQGEAIAPWAGVEGDEARFTLTGLAPGKVTLRAYVDGEFVRLGEFVAPAEDLAVPVPAR